MKRLLLITAGDFTHTGGIERYNTILFNILKKYYVNYSIDVILTFSSFFETGSKCSLVTPLIKPLLT